MAEERSAEEKVTEFEFVDISELFLRYGVLENVIAEAQVGADNYVIIRFRKHQYTFDTIAIDMNKLYNCLNKFRYAQDRILRTQR